MNGVLGWVSSFGVESKKHTTFSLSVISVLIFGQDVAPMLAGAQHGRRCD